MHNETGYIPSLITKVLVWSPLYLQ